MAIAHREVGRHYSHKCRSVMKSDGRNTNEGLHLMTSCTTLLVSLLCPIYQNCVGLIDCSFSNYVYTNPKTFA